MVHVLGGIDAEGVDIELLGEREDVVRELLGDLMLLVVEVGEVAGEEAVDRAAVPRAGRGATDAAGALEPGRVGGHIGVLLVHMVHDEVEEDADAAAVGLCDELLEPLRCAGARVAKAALNAGAADRPVAVKAAELAAGIFAVAFEAAVGVLVDGAEPDELNAHALKVAAPHGLEDALEVAALVVCPGIDARNGAAAHGAVAVAEAVDEGEIHDRIAPVEALRLHPERDEEGAVLGRTTARVGGGHAEAVLSWREARGSHRDEAGRPIDGGRDLGVANRDTDGGRVDGRGIARRGELDGGGEGPIRRCDGGDEPKERLLAVADDEVAVLRPTRPLGVDVGRHAGLEHTSDRNLEGILTGRQCDLGCPGAVTICIGKRRRAGRPAVELARRSDRGDGAGRPVGDGGCAAPELGGRRDGGVFDGRRVVREERRIFARVGECGILGCGRGVGVQQTGVVGDAGVDIVAADTRIVAGRCELFGGEAAGQREEDEAGSDRPAAGAEKGHRVSL